MLGKIGLTAVAATSFFSTWIGTAGADPVKEFYSKKTVNLMVGFAPGGGADLWGRFIARHLGDFIPGRPAERRGAEHAWRRWLSLRGLCLQRRAHGRHEYSNAGSHCDHSAFARRTKRDVGRI